MLNRDRATGWEGGNPTLDVVVGITSFGEGACDEHLPGIYTNVSSFRQWISETMGDVSLSVFALLFKSFMPMPSRAPSHE